MKGVVGLNELHVHDESKSLSPSLSRFRQNPNLIGANPCRICDSDMLYTLRSSGAREFGFIAFYRHTDPLDRKPGLYEVISVTWRKNYPDGDNGVL